MRIFNKLFLEHPASVDESYIEHMGVASSFGIRMILGGFACVVHGIFPFMFVKTGSAQVSHLHDVMVANRNRHPSGSAQQA